MTRKPRTNPEASMKEKSDPPAPAENVFEVDRIRALVQIMEEHDLSEIDLRESRHRIRICRGQQVVLTAPQAAAMSQPAYAPPPGAVGAGAAPASAPAAANIAYIKSPMVGTYYCRPNPKSEAYVKVGDQVDANTVVCIIEAMKVFNEIPAEIQGKVLEILVQDGESVDFEKPLFKIETSK